MSATALISGKLFREPEAKVSRAGKYYASATVRVGDGEGATWWKVLSFSENWLVMVPRALSHSATRPS